jgi:hypothetical protein
MNQTILLAQQTDKTLSRQPKLEEDKDGYVI